MTVSNFELWAARVLEFIPQAEDPRSADQIIVEFLEYLDTSTNSTDSTAKAFIEKLEEYFAPEIFGQDE